MPPRPSALMLALAALLLPAAARADRTQVYSIQGADCADCGDRVKRQLKKVKGVKKVEFDVHAVEIKVRMADGVADQAILEGVHQAGLKAVVGPGHGAYLPQEGYSKGADVVSLTEDGSSVGPLEKHRVAGKYTVFDVYAVWCGPCRLVDRRLREILVERRDVALRRLNVVDFDSALARELGPGFDSLPFVVVYSPGGKRREIVGANLERLDAALRSP